MDLWKFLLQIASWDYNTGLNIEKKLTQHTATALPANRTRIVTTIIVSQLCRLLSVSQSINLYFGQKLIERKTRDEEVHSMRIRYNTIREFNMD